ASAKVFCAFDGDVTFAGDGTFAGEGGIMQGQRHMEVVMATGQFSNQLPLFANQRCKASRWCTGLQQKESEPFYVDTCTELKTTVSVALSQYTMNSRRHTLGFFVGA
ncbi:hypothetical protein A2U01_0056763, partial [Trifolium medium]|nr:hypothetical protein [Trifolium medium]